MTVKLILLSPTKLLSPCSPHPKPPNPRDTEYTLEAASQVPVLTGCPVSNGNYFLFPDLSVRHEGNYRLCFNLYEMTSNPNNGDDTGSERDIGNREQEHYAEATTPRDECIWRTKSSLRCFVFSVRKSFLVYQIVLH